ncbi:MAG: hypothetical protein WBA43_25465 [Elainellaceae cyanobacterium]
MGDHAGYTLCFGAIAGVKGLDTGAPGSTHRWEQSRRKDCL